MIVTPPRLSREIAPSHLALLSSASSSSRNLALHPVAIMFDVSVILVYCSQLERWWYWWWWRWSCWVLSGCSLACCITTINNTTRPCPVCRQRPGRRTAGLPRRRHRWPRRKNRRRRRLRRRWRRRRRLWRRRLSSHRHHRSRLRTVPVVPAAAVVIVAARPREPP